MRKSSESLANSIVSKIVLPNLTFLKNLHASNGWGGEASLRILLGEMNNISDDIQLSSSVALVEQ